MPYARPSTMPTTNGVSAVLESRFSLGDPSTSSSSTRNDDRDYHPPHTAGMSWQQADNSNITTWQQNVSSSFAQLSQQFQAASQAVSTIPPTQDHVVMTSFLERLDAIEEGQRKLGQEIQLLTEQFTSHRDSDRPAANDATGLEASLKEQIELYKLDQERLPGRLQNALATKSLSPIKILPMRNRKTPPNFPSTRGEFEHLTKERYEALMASYDVPISGDTNAKRETLRAFLGIPATPIEKK